jgi:hypothetical protein
LFLGEDVTWVSSPTADAGIAEDFFNQTPTNPTDFISEFDVEGATVEEIGSDTVRGVATTRYRITVDPSKLPESERAEVEQLSPLPNGELPIDLWIGDDDLVYRMVIDLDGAAMDFENPEEEFDRMLMTWEIYDYGADLVIEAPPADEVTDAGELGDLADLFG